MRRRWTAIAGLCPIGARNWCDVIVHSFDTLLVNAMAKYELTVAIISKNCILVAQECKPNRTSFSCTTNSLLSYSGILAVFVALPIMDLVASATRSGSDRDDYISGRAANLGTVAPPDDSLGLCRRKIPQFLLL